MHVTVIRCIIRTLILHTSIKNIGQTLQRKGFVGKELGKSKNDYGRGGIFFGLFLAPKIKYCLVIDEIGINSEKRTFKGYNETKIESYLVKNFWN